MPLTIELASTFTLLEHWGYRPWMPTSVLFATVVFLTVTGPWQSRKIAVRFCVKVLLTNSTFLSLESM